MQEPVTKPPWDCTCSIGSQQISYFLVNLLNAKREALIFPIYCKSLVVLVVQVLINTSIF